jgi:hypothetical protein
MSFNLIDLAASLEGSDELHEARLILLLYAAAGKGVKTHAVEGIMKLAKMDFLLRYPNVLARALETISETKKRAKKLAESLSDEQRDTIEGRMIRFRYGPWDKRYRRWLAVLVAKNLVEVTKDGRTINTHPQRRHHSRSR